MWYEGGMKILLETERLMLCAWWGEDAEAAFRIYGDPAVMRFIGTGATTGSVEETATRLQRYIGHHEKFGFGLWATFEKSTGRLIGNTGLTSLDGGPEIELGYHLAKEAWGKGYATEVAGALLDYGFQTLGLKKILAVTHPDNVASQRVLEKVGMSRQGMGHYYGAELVVYVVEEVTK